MRNEVVVIFSRLGRAIDAPVPSQGGRPNRSASKIEIADPSNRDATGDTRKQGGDA